VSEEFFWNTATGTLITIKRMADYNALQKFLNEKNINYLYFAKRRIKRLKPLSGIFLTIFLQRTSLWPSRG
jgi:hypothetical protein